VVKVFCKINSNLSTAMITSSHASYSLKPDHWSIQQRWTYNSGLKIFQNV